MASSFTEGVKSASDWWTTSKTNVNSEISEGFDKWLDTVTTLPFMHKTVMFGTSLLASTKAVRGTLSLIANSVVGSDFFSTAKTGLSKATDLLNKLNQLLMSPNIEGIPISATSVKVSREVDISESLVIVQDTYGKDYKTDNAVPHLREWNLEGYLTSVSNLDNMLLIKPTLMLQMKYLDACAASRKPVWFKTDNNEFFKVQITRLYFERVAESTNAVHVLVSLKEFKPYIVEDEQVSLMTLQKVRTEK